MPQPPSENVEEVSQFLSNPHKATHGLLQYSKSIGIGTLAVAEGLQDQIE